MKSVLAAVAALSIVTGAASSALALMPAVEYTSADDATDSRPFSIGYVFDLTSAVTVDALGYWNDGLANNHQVGIWDVVGNLLVSTTVAGDDTLVGHFRWDSVAPVTLAAGRYTIAGEFLGNGNPFPVSATGITNIAQYSYVGSVQSQGGFQPPTDSFGANYGGNGIFVANFSVVPTGAIPEPATWGLMIVGFGGIGAILRRRRDASVFA